MNEPRGAGQHRAQPGAGRRRAAPVAGKRRADVRPRYGRIAVLTASALVTGISVLGGFGLIPTGPEDATADSGAGSPAVERHADARPPADHRKGREASLTTTTADRKSPSSTSAEDAAPALPPASGSGRRVVFDQSDQRVWLVAGSGRVSRSYLVSGSLTDNLDPGTYSVYSRSRWAVGLDDSGVMEYFVRFTQGDSGAAIGFHTIPTKDGVPLQTAAQLGTPQSHGCIRQRTPDAIALWQFAPIGTTVVVTA